MDCVGGSVFERASAPWVDPISYTGRTLRITLTCAPAPLDRNSSLPWRHRKAVSRGTGRRLSGARRPFEYREAGDWPLCMVAERARSPERRLIRASEAFGRAPGCRSMPGSAGISPVPGRHPISGASPSSRSPPQYAASTRGLRRAQAGMCERHGMRSLRARSLR